jgi:hypothetical protein
MLTQQDSDLVNQFYNSLADKVESMGIPLRLAGQNETRDNNGDVYLVSFYFQVMMSKFELFVNTRMPRDRRYGWRQV